MKQRWKRWFRRTLGLGLAVVVAGGCTSTEDRIASVIGHELEQCRQSDDVFYKVTTRDGDEFEVLSELCHLEPSEVRMVNEWRGVVNTGPAAWTAEQDESRRGAVLITRVAWPELETALGLHNRRNQDVEHMESAEAHFATVEEEYGESAWIRQQRLDNLLKLRTETMSSDDGQSIVGDDAEEYHRQFVAWARQAERPEALALAHLALIDHIAAYRQRQQDSMDRIGSGDRRWEARIGHAEDDGDMDLARELRAEFEEIKERRPEQRERLEKLMNVADRQACQYVDELSELSIEDETLQRRITQTTGRYDCNFDEVVEETKETSQHEQVQ